MGILKFKGIVGGMTQMLFETSQKPEQQAETPYNTVPVQLPLPIDKAYNYKPLADQPCGIGSYVAVPVGKRNEIGVVWTDNPADDPKVVDKPIDSKKIKEILHRYDLPPMTITHQHFLRWVADYTMSPLGAVLKMSLSVPAALEAAKPAKAYILPEKLKQVDALGLSPARQKILSIMADTLPRRAAEIVKSAKCTPAVIKAMVADGQLQEIDIFASYPCAHPDPEFNPVTLSPTQHDIALSLQQKVLKQQFESVLLDGVTGSGKTEVYFEAVAEALKQKKQILILLPEIVLSNAFIDRFQNRFGCAPALWHSSLTPAQRRQTWRGVVSGQTKLVVGARSALFLPYKDLGLIVVDEEHDPAYKQEDGVIYQARDMAVMRAHYGQCPVILVSATPSLETMNNVWQGKYTHMVLPDRFGGATMPKITIVDLRKDKPERQEFISPLLKKAITDHLQKNEQVLLFLNRRGYAPLTLCRSCGHRLECPRCTAWLVEHRAIGKLQCHHCGYSAKLPNHCPSCDAVDNFAACGPGVERIREEVAKSFPEARTIILASDQTDTHDSLKDALNSIHNHEVDIIIGTQIIAKGHHFPKLTCVGIVDADLGLAGGDLRASERTFQLLHQVAGRAGREELAGEVFVQSWQPENKVIQTLARDDRDKFLAIESQERQRAHMPPYSRLAGLVIEGTNEGQVRAIALEIGKTAPSIEGLRVLGPAPAPLYRIRGRYRQRLLVQAGRKLPLQKIIHDWLAPIKIPRQIDVTVDIDPQNFL